MSASLSPKSQVNLSCSLILLFYQKKTQNTNKQENPESHLSIHYQNRNQFRNLSFSQNRMVISSLHLWKKMQSPIPAASIVCPRLWFIPSTARENEKKHNTLGQVWSSLPTRQPLHCAWMHSCA